MSADQLVSVIALVGWLVLVGSAVASFRLGWSRMLRLGLIWLAIFAGLFLVVELVGPF